MAGHATHDLIPHLVVDGAARAIEFYKTAFGAVEVARVPEPRGTRLMQAELKIGDAALFLGDDFPEHHCGASRVMKAGARPVTLHLDVPNCDAAIARAAAAGAIISRPAMDMFWGDRYGQVTDPFGHEWSFAHRLTDEQAAAAARNQLGF